MPGKTPMPGQTSSWTRRRFGGALALLLAAAGCASPEPAYYRLAGVPGQPRAGRPQVVALRRVGLARYLDRSEIVRGGRGAQVDVLSGERWAEPLGDMVSRVLAEDLTQRLPGSTVFAEGGALSIDSDVAVELEIQRFEADAGGTVTLLAQAAVQLERSRTRTGAQPIRIAIPAGGTGTGAIVAAMSTALGALADAVAAMLAPQGGR